MITVGSQSCARNATAVQGKNARCSTVAKAAAAEVATVRGPTLTKAYHGPHAVAEDAIERITNMLREGDLFRYGGQDEGSLQVRTSGESFSCRAYCVGQDLHQNASTWRPCRDCVCYCVRLRATHGRGRSWEVYHPSCGNSVSPIHVHEYCALADCTLSAPSLCQSDKGIVVIKMLWFMA